MATYRSAFDPLFWVHHANIDRQFWQWQQDEGHMSTIPRVVQDYPCQPFQFKDIRAKAFFDTRALGYTYSVERNLVLAGAAAAALAQGASPLAPLPLDFGLVRVPFKRARINVHGIRHPEQTCELRFFANRDTPADASTAQTEAEHFLGSYMLLGHGPCPGAPGHCDPDLQTGRGIRPPHHLAPFDVFVDATAGVQALEGRDRLQVDGQLIVVDSKGEQLPTSTVRFDNASLTLR
jgi:tyrosinase